MRGKARLLAVAAAAAGLLSVGCSDAPGQAVADVAESGERHVQMVHIDGLRPDVLRTMLDAGRLPNFEYLISRGKISYNTSTVDKSETMKVIQSYLTSRVDTHVVGWWQFNRSDFRFRNYWLDPAEVVNYALGLEFPLYPTALDVVAADGHNLSAGMSLSRRGVPFNNYGRPYLEGFKAVSDHTYFNQAHATMESHLEVLRRIGRSDDEPTPRMSLLLIGAPDEFAHAEGITSAAAPVGEHCFDRGEHVSHEAFFELLDNDEEHEAGGDAESYYDRYFTKVKTSWWSGDVKKVCIAPVVVQAYSEPPSSGATTIGWAAERAITPEYLLAVTQMDIELGYLINTLRSIRFDGARRFYQPTRDLPSYIASGQREGSLFEQTLLLVFGDHGMVDSKHMMAPPSDNPQRAAGSLDVGFLDYLNQRLALTSGAGETTLPADVELGVDFSNLPDRLVSPHRHPEWHSAEVAAKTAEAVAFSEEFFAELKEALREEAHKKYWWMFFLKSLIIDPKLDDATEPVEGKAIDALSKMYLRGELSYQVAEAAANRAYFDEHVRLVYGGGARNNAELFLPVCDGASCRWGARPSFDQIVAYRGGSASSETLIDALRANPGVGLIFVRRQNDAIFAGKPLPTVLDIMVMDRLGNSGTISVWRDGDSGRQLYSYQVDPSSQADPLAYGHLGEGAVGTYYQWNDWSVELGHYYHNVVAGIGSYLYSSNPSIGDILVTHSQGWNFGDNAGGHGGVHRGEKITVMFASGPGIDTGVLTTDGGYEVGAGGAVARTDAMHHPTLLDLAPTALAWLGYAPDALTELAASGRFESYLADWTAEQRDDILDNLGGVDSLKQALAEAGFDDFRIDQFNGRLERLLQFTELADPELPNYAGATTDGHPLKLR